MPADGPLRVALPRRAGAALRRRAADRGRSDSSTAIARARRLRVCGTGEDRRPAEPRSADGDRARARRRRAGARAVRAHPGRARARRTSASCRRCATLHRAAAARQAPGVRPHGPAGVAPRLPVIERYFDDDAVRFFEPGSPAALAAAVEDILHDPAAAQARAARATDLPRTARLDRAAPSLSGDGRRAHGSRSSAPRALAAPTGPLRARLGACGRLAWRRRPRTVPGWPRFPGAIRTSWRMRPALASAGRGRRCAARA